MSRLLTVENVSSGYGLTPVLRDAPELKSVQTTSMLFVFSL